MSTFEEYAALVRQLSDRVRTGERGASAEAERRRGLHVAADQLGQRLAAQGERLDQLGRAIGAPPVPAPLPPPDPSSATVDLALGPAAEADPAAELEAARRLADGADRCGQQAEGLAHRPALLPTWSPLARALAVYGVCATAGVLLMLVMVAASGVGLVNGLTLGAGICAGLPVASFFAGYLVLGRWGRPAIGPGDPPRFVPLGFVICALLVPFAYCASLLVVRVLR